MKTVDSIYTTEWYIPHSGIPVNCRRFCSCQSTLVQQKSTSFNDEGATDTTAITWKQQNSTDFNKGWNLVRDQGVGGSNPLSPTNLSLSLSIV